MVSVSIIPENIDALYNLTLPDRRIIKIFFFLNFHLTSTCDISIPPCIQIRFAFTLRQRKTIATMNKLHLLKTN